MRGLRLSIGLAALFVAAALAGAASGQTAYPTRAITLIVPASAGGATDIIARLVGQHLGTSLGKPVIVENRPGANGIIAAQSVLNAPADGYNLLVGYTAISQNIAMRAETPYRLSDFTALSQVYSSGTFFAVSSRLGLNTLEEFVRAAREKPGAFSYGSFGIGSTAHIFGEALKKAAKIDLVHVPYRGETLILNDLMGGQIEAGWGSFGTLKPQADANTVRILAVSGTQRAPAAPDVPTFAERNYPELSLNGWNGFLVRAGTPEDIVRKLSEEISRIAQMPDVRTKIEGFGFVPVGSNSQEFTAFLNADAKSWTDTVKALDIQIKE